MRTRLLVIKNSAGYTAKHGYLKPKMTTAVSFRALDIERRMCPTCRVFPHHYTLSESKAR